MNLNQKQFQEGLTSKSKVLPLDQMANRKTYAITVNPDQSNFSGFVEAKSFMEHKLLPLFNGACKLYTELSTQSQNIHYHGVIRWFSLKSLTKFYTNIQEINRYCQFEIDEINDHWVWINYITKSRPHMEHLNVEIDLNPIRYIDQESMNYVRTIKYLQRKYPTIRRPVIKQYARMKEELNSIEEITKL